MPLERSRQYDDAKKASGSSNRRDVKKNNESSEDRMNRYDWFLKPLKSLAIGTMMLTAGMGGVEARPEAPSSALQRKEHDNTTDLPPAFHQQEFNNLSHPTALEFNPHKVTPELLDHLSKFAKNPENFAQNVQKRDNHQIIQKRQQRQEMRRLVEKAREHPEVLESLKKLFEEVPEQNHRKLLAESRLPSEQKSHETDLMKLDKGAERLTPEKIAPEVWESVGRMLTEKQRNLNDNSDTTIVLVHGIELYGTVANCNDGYWRDAITFLKENGYSDCRTVKYYNSDTNCDVDLHNSSYADPCSNYCQGSEGTTNEDLNHISCLLAQYLYQNFGQSNKNVVLVGHSMGGIIVRNTMYLTQVNAESPVIPIPFPPSIGTVTDAVTFNSPHGGVPSDGGLVGLFGCLDCKQVEELTSGSDFLNGLGLYPQVPGSATRWTIVGSQCDTYVSAVSAISMNANQAVVYSIMGESDNTCYDHGGALHDSNVNNIAIQYTCSTDDPVNSPCGTAYASTNGPWTVGQGPCGLQELCNAASS
jgi:triacylglycerol esterase/lipase EstA (alpha/beta hydrolase family)